MALAIPGFPADEFRAGIRLAMRMGLPVEEARQPQFVTVPAGTGIATVAVDANGVPWDPSVAPEAPEDVAVRVLCAFEQRDPAQANEDFGTRQPSAYRITLLDEEYAQIEGFTYVNIWPTLTGGPVRYFYRKVVQQPSLDVVGVWQIECSTEDTL